MIMKKISSMEALEQVRSMGIAYVMEFDSLAYLIEDKEEVECYMNEEILVTIHPHQDTTYITVLPLCSMFDVEKLLSLVAKSTQKVSMLINVQALDKKFIEKLDGQLEHNFMYERKLVDYVCNDQAKTNASENIRLLCSADKNIFVACSQEQIKNRPPLAVLFDIFIDRHQGQILAYFDEGKVVGYLSFNTIADHVYDVDHICVVPERRRQGIGKKLAAAYAWYAQRHGYCAYWSNAKNEASEKTAMSCGFNVVRQAYKFVSKT